MTKPTRILGVVEGFYGVFYTFPQRISLIRFIGSHGYNAYLYAPKNDRQHRVRWWEPYPARTMENFEETVAAGRESGVDFCYGISPGLSISYSAPHDFMRLTEKLQAFYDIGVRSFCLMLDDTQPGFRHAEDAQVYPSPAIAHASLANRLHAWLTSLDPSCSLSLCPVEYFGSAPFSPALHQLGEALSPQIDIFYTGPEICSPSITSAYALDFTRSARRAPLLWDNYPVNDLSMQPELHLGPVTGRSEDLVESVSGIFVNPMLQAEATRIPLLTYAAYVADSYRYQPQLAWDTALRTVAGEENIEQMRLLAENVVISFLESGRGQVLSRLAEAAVTSLQNTPNPDNSVEVKALEDYLTAIDESCYHLKYRMDNLALRDDLLSWIEVMEHWVWMTRRALTVLRSRCTGQEDTGALSGMLEYRDLIQRHPRKIASDSLLALVDLVLNQEPQPAPVQVNSKTERRLPRFTFPKVQWSKAGRTA